MKDELAALLSKYDKAELSEEELERLRALVATPEGRRRALAGDTPEAVFLAEDEYREPEWEQYWERFATRLESQNRWRPEKPRSKGRYLAAAAAVLIIAGASALGIFLNPGETPQTVAQQTVSYTLRHRAPAEVQPQLRTLLGKDAEISVDYTTNTISITDDAGRAAKMRRALEMLDRKPIELRFEIAFLKSLNPGAEAIRSVDALPTRELNLDDYRVLQRLELKTVEGRQFREVIDGRYEISCFVQLNPEATEAYISNLRVYDREKRAIVLSAADITLGAGWTRTLRLETGGEASVAAVSLPPLAEEPAN